MIQNNSGSNRIFDLLAKIILGLCGICLILFVVVLFRNCSCAGGGVQETEKESRETESSSQIPANSVILNTVNEYDQAYIDSIIFFGESTTAHMRSRGVLSGGTNTKQVWADSSNTMMLDIDIGIKSIVYPDTGKEMTVADAVAQKKPKYIVLTFGLNGIVSFHNNQQLFVGSYKKLIETIQENSPNTKIILQSAFPVAEAKYQSSWAYSASPDMINEYIDTLNEWAIDIAKSFENVKYIDTAQLLKDANGYLRPEYQTDGIHLTADAYKAILNYIGTHKYTD